MREIIQRKKYTAYPKMAKISDSIRIAILIRIDYDIKKTMIYLILISLSFFVYNENANFTIFYN